MDSCGALGCPEPERIDRIFFRSSEDLSWTPRLWELPEGWVDDAGTPLSDHDPIALEIDWETETG